MTVSQPIILQALYDNTLGVKIFLSLDMFTSNFDALQLLVLGSSDPEKECSYTSAFHEPDPRARHPGAIVSL